MKIGDKVRINPNSEFRSQGEDYDGSFMIGEIIETLGEMNWWKVKWEDDYINLYRYNDLIIALDLWREKQLEKLI